MKVENPKDFMKYFGSLSKKMCKSGENAKTFEYLHVSKYRKLSMYEMRKMVTNTYYKTFSEK
jgi:hypothetical protein